MNVRDFFELNNDKKNSVREYVNKYRLNDILKNIETVSQESDDSRYCSIYTYKQYSLLKIMVCL